MNRLTLGGLCLALALAAGGARAGQDKEPPPIDGKPLAEWIKALKDKDVTVRFQAVQVLSRAGPEARAAVPALLDTLRDKEAGGLFEALVPPALAGIGPGAVPALAAALKDPEPIVRRAAALALRLIGPGAKEAVPALRDALHDKQPLVRMFAAAALGAVGADARPASAALSQAMRDDADLRVRVEAAVAVWKIDGQAAEPVAVLGAVLKEKDATVRQSAAQGLGLIGPGAAETVPALAKLLQDRDAGARREATFALSQVGGRAGSAGAAIRQALEDRDAGVRWWAALAALNLDLEDRATAAAILEVLSETSGRLWIGGRPAEAVQSALRPGAAKPLMKALGRRDIVLRREAARLLGMIGPEAKTATPALLLALRDEDETLRRRAADALGRMGPEVVPNLLRLFVQGEARAREGAARALGWQGPEVGPAGRRSAVLQLQAALQEKEAPVRVQAALALWRIDGQTLRPTAVLLEVLSNPESTARWQAAEALGVICRESQPPPQGATEALAKALKDADLQVRVSAVRALWRIDRQARVVVPLVRPALDDANSTPRLMAVELLGELGPSVAGTALLTEALNDKEETVRRAAVAALAQVGPEAVPALVKALQHSSAAVRAGAAEALGWIGPDARSAIKPLLEVVADRDARLRQRAEFALFEIEPDAAAELLEKARKPQK